jgi:hypothetical protein
LKFNRRTTNVVESPFATVRLRTTAAKRFKKAENATALIWKLLQVAESTLEEDGLQVVQQQAKEYRDSEDKP